MSTTVKSIRELFPAEEGWAIRSWLTVNEDGRCVVQVTLSDIDDHIIASSFGSSPEVEWAEDNALSRLALVVFGEPHE